MNMKTFFVPVFLLSFIVAGSLFATNRMVAEWEPMRGVLIRHPFGVPVSLINEMAIDDTVYILVQNSSAQSQANAVLSHISVNMSHVRYITAPTNSHWTRDWGPHSIFVDDAVFGIADPIFNGYPWVPGRDYERPYEDDDAVNSVLADYFGSILLDFPGYLTGGNFMTDGYGTAFSTAQMVSENFSLMPSDQFLQYASNLLGINRYLFTINPELYGIQHIDCWAKLLNEDTVLVKQLPMGHPEYDRAEQIAAQFATTNSSSGRAYRVIRIYCGTYQGNNVAAYTNSLILNSKVYVPLFGIPSDQQALQTYIDAMPGYEIIGFTGTWYYYDALHCRTMGIADGEMLRIEHQSPPPVTEIIDDTLQIMCRIKSYGGHNLLNSSLVCHYKIGEGSEWSNVVLLPSGVENNFSALISGLSNGDILQYWIEAYDVSGRHTKHPIMAPISAHYTQISSTPSSLMESFIIQPEVHVYPQPSQGTFKVTFEKAPTSPVEIEIYNLRGQLMFAQRDSKQTSPGVYSIDLAKDSIKSGIYIMRVKRQHQNITRKVIVHH